MNIKYTDIIAIIALASILPFQTYADSIPEPTDSTEENVTELQEVLVEGRRAWVEGERMIFLPSKKERNLAYDATSLVERMDLPVVTVSGGRIMSRDEKPVAIYINGMPASEETLQVFYPQNARRVEYIEHSTDPRYAGAPYVINFVMKEYLYGGLTHLTGTQQIPNSGAYSGSSKMVYKDMTYIASVSGGYSRDHRNKTSENSVMRDILYDGNPYDVVSIADRQLATANRRDYVDASFYASYLNSAKMFRADHWANINWSRTPDNFNRGAMRYTPGIVPSRTFDFSSDGKSMAASANGAYLRQFARCLISGNWQYTHAHQRQDASYTASGLAPIVNNISEDYDKVVGTVNWGMQFGRKLYLSVTAQGAVHWYDTRYLGSADSDEKLIRGGMALVPSLTWMPMPALRFTVSPNAQVMTTRINHEKKECEINPGADVAVNASIGRQHSFMLSAEYFPSRPSAAQLEDVTLREDQLMWVAGNPDLDTPQEVVARFNYNWLPSNRLDIRAYFTWGHIDNPVLYRYTPAPAALGGIVRGYANGDREGSVITGVSFNWRPFRGFRLSGAGRYIHYYAKGPSSITLDAFKYGLKASYSFGACAVDLEWKSPSKELANCGTVIRRKSRQELDFSFSWGNGILFVTAGLRNLLNTYSRTCETLDSRFYGFSSETFSTGRQGFVTLSYFLEYGRKTDPQMGDYNSAGADSSILH